MASAGGATLSGTLVNATTSATRTKAGSSSTATLPSDVVTGVTVTDNIVGPANNWGQTNGPPTTAGIIVGVDQLPVPAAIAPKITDTVTA